VVFDLDETLLSQWYKAGAQGPRYYSQTTGKEDWVAFAMWRTARSTLSFIPNWERLREDIILPGCRGIALFPPRKMRPLWTSLTDGTWKGFCIAPKVLGVFTRNYLARNAKMVKGAKDLRIIDPTLEHVILVTTIPPGCSSPERAPFPPYNADSYYHDKRNKGGGGNW